MEFEMEERSAARPKAENFPNPAWIGEVRRVARGIRRRVLEHTVQNSGGYLSQACSAAEIFAALYVKLLHLGPVESPLVPPPFPGVPGAANLNYQTGAMFNGPKSADWDRFILSPSQYALVLYATLVEVGRMDPEGLRQFNQDGSSVEMIGAEHSPGMEVMTGSLGQGLSQAAGLAMARKRRGESGKVWVFMSDGELQSGQNWEAMQAIAFHQLDNLRIIVDVNQQQCDGAVAQVMKTEPLDQRLAAFGARVQRIDGHSIERLADLAELAEWEPDGRALVVLADTDPCAGIDLLKARAPKLHYIRFSSPKEQQAFAAALAEF